MHSKRADFANFFGLSCSFNVVFKLSTYLLSFILLKQDFVKVECYIHYYVDVFRRIFPTLQFSLEGLEKNRFYTVCVDMLQVGISQWKYQSSRWIPTGKAQRQLPSKSRSRITTNNVYNHRFCDIWYITFDGCHVTFGTVNHKILRAQSVYIHVSVPTEAQNGRTYS